MKLHRFYVGDEVELKHDFWLHDQNLLNQWRRVLRFRSGQQLILFDGVGEDRLYEIAELTEREAHLKLVTEMKRSVPSKNVYLLFSLLKKDKNEWVLQKCTELGVSHFIPLIADRSEKTGFNAERARKIVIEASEQCGRSDIPSIREPMHIDTAIEELQSKVDLYICEQGEQTSAITSTDIGVFIGPEGGWSDVEKQLFNDKELGHLSLHDFTLRAETACVAAATKLLQ